MPCKAMGRVLAQRHSPQLFQHSVVDNFPCLQGFWAPKIDRSTDVRKIREISHIFIYIISGQLLLLVVIITILTCLLVRERWSIIWHCKMPLHVPVLITSLLYFGPDICPFQARVCRRARGWRPTLL